MCLAIPMKLIDVQGTTGLAELGSVERRVDISLLDNPKPGQYVVVHAGFAITLIDEDEALKTLALFREIEEKGALL